MNSDGGEGNIDRGVEGGGGGGGDCDCLGCEQ